MTTSSSSCQDAMPAICPIIANTGYCIDPTYGEWMAQNCQKSCNTCGYTTPYTTPPRTLSTTSTTTVIVTTTTSSGSDGTCKDTLVNCQILVNNGGCDNQVFGDWVMENCKKSCDACPDVTCKDIWSEKKCKKMKKKCQNKKKVKKNCMETCNACGDDNKDCEDVWSAKKCKKMKKKGKCNNKKVSKNCKKFCNHCKN